MNKSRAFFTLFFTARFALIAFAVGMGMLALPRIAAAQQNLIDDSVDDVSGYCDEGFDCQLESYSAIYDTSSTSHLDAESDTLVNLDALDDGFAAYDCAEVGQDSAILAEGCVDDDGSGEADQAGSFSLNSQTSDSYAIVTDSYLADVADDPFACDDGDPDFCFPIDETGEDVIIGPVEIDSISPNGVDVGTSGSLTISGADLVNPFGGSEPDVTASLSGNTTGLTLSNPNFSADGTQGTVSYSAASNAPTGEWNVGLSYSMGEPLLINTGTYGSFTVGYPPAVITNVSPSTWTAGAVNLQVTITGQNFGTAPTLSVNAVGVTLSGYTANPNGKSISATVNVAQTAPSEAVSIQVQPGYTGSTFICVCNGQPPDGTSTATVIPVTPTPQIMFNGNNISGTTQNVYAGQQIPLTVTVPSPYAIQSQTWSFGNASDVVGGYSPTSASGSVTQVTSTTQNNLKFYFIAIGETETVTVNITCNNGQPATATATFTVQGPTGSSLPTAYLQTDITGTHVPSATGNPATLGMYNAPQQNNPNVGVWFKEPAGQPANNAGRFIWVQILNSVVFTQLAATNSGYTAPTNAANQLDGIYPYPSNADVAASANPPTVATSSLASDAPSRQDLSGVLGEAAKSFDATMYVLWDPALPAGCTPATVNTSTTPYTANPITCTSIPVPMGTIDWTWSGCAINGLASIAGGGHTNSWSVQCGKGSQSANQSSDYPTWNSCYKSLYGGCK